MSETELKFTVRLSKEETRQFLEIKHVYELESNAPMSNNDALRQAISDKFKQIQITENNNEQE